jgi:hypothetical protein
VSIVLVARDLQDVCGSSKTERLNRLHRLGQARVVRSREERRVVSGGEGIEVCESRDERVEGRSVR